QDIQGIDDPRFHFLHADAATVAGRWAAIDLLHIDTLANGIPVLASDRGGLPETLGGAGFVFALPERLLVPGSVALPTLREVAPWVAAVERLWDGPGFECCHRDLARTEARRWDGERLAGEYTAFFRAIAARR